MGMTLKTSASELSEKISTLELALEFDYRSLCYEIRTAENFKFSQCENLEIAIAAQYREDEPEMDEPMT